MNIIQLWQRSLIMNIVLFEAIGYGVSGSLNPLKFFEIDNLLMKIVLIILMVSMLIMALSLIVSSKTIPPDAECHYSECPVKNIRAGYLMLGGAVKCRKGGEWYHKRCWELYNGQSIWEATKTGMVCKDCREKQESDWLSSEDDLDEEW